MLLTQITLLSENLKAPVLQQNPLFLLHQDSFEAVLPQKPLAPGQLLHQGICQFLYNQIRYTRLALINIVNRNLYLMPLFYKQAIYIALRIIWHAIRLRSITISFQGDI
jgi:hypothetical protein